MTIIMEDVDVDLEDNNDIIETETEIETDEEGFPTEESDSDSSCCECLDTPRDGTFRFAPTLVSSPPEKHEFTLDEDEEDLPPFDEWYQDIASRTY